MLGSRYLCGLCVSPLGITYLAVASMTSSNEWHSRQSVLENAVAEAGLRVVEDAAAFAGGACLGVVFGVGVGAEAHRFKLRASAKTDAVVARMRNRSLIF